MIPAKTIISGYAAANPWFGINYNMNIYKGCSHGCIYCDSRSDCYRVEDFDRVRAKAGALDLIARELKGKRRQGVVGTGAMSDPYNPQEKEAQLTRGALELIHRYNFGIAITTKSDLIVRDIDLLRTIASHSPVLVKLTVTTADDELAARIEPGAPPPSRRLAALAQLRKAGIFAGVLLMPLLPFITDTWENMAQILRQAAAGDASFVFPSYGVTLRQNQREYFLRQIAELFPGMDLAYLRQFRSAYECNSPNAMQLRQEFRRAATAQGLLHSMPDIIAAYRQPYQQTQATLF